MGHAMHMFFLFQMFPFMRLQAYQTGIGHSYPSPLESHQSLLSQYCLVWASDAVKVGCSNIWYGLGLDVDVDKTTRKQGLGYVSSSQ